MSVGSAWKKALHSRSRWSCSSLPVRYRCRRLLRPDFPDSRCAFFAKADADQRRAGCAPSEFRNLAGLNLFVACGLLCGWAGKSWDLCHGGRHAARRQQAQSPAGGSAGGDGQVRAQGKRIPQKGPRRARGRAPFAPRRDPGPLRLAGGRWIRAVWNEPRRPWRSGAWRLNKVHARSRYLNTLINSLIAYGNPAAAYCAWGCFSIFCGGAFAIPHWGGSAWSRLTARRARPYSSASSTTPITSTMKPAAVAAANDRSTLSMMPPRCRRATFPPWLRRTMESCRPMCRQLCDRMSKLGRARGQSAASLATFPDTVRRV